MVYYYNKNITNRSYEKMTAGSPTGSGPTEQPSRSLPGPSISQDILVPSWVDALHRKQKDMAVDMGMGQY